MLQDSSRGKDEIGVIQDLNLLLQLLAIDSAAASSLLRQHTDNFPLCVPIAFVNRMRKGDLNDPLLLQVLPQAIEENVQVQQDGLYSADPLAESQFSPVPGVLHKYHGRALLLLTANCPINCRFCFRRHHRPQVASWAKALEYIGNERSISEVILSGGEPLLYSHQDLSWLLKQLATMPHVRRVRIHTRAPIVMPEVINEKVLNIFHEFQELYLLPIVWVIHCNHPQEIDSNVIRALNALRAAGKFTLLNQTVLLKGINDDAVVLAELSEKLFTAGVIPYYLHMLDKVKGAAHFSVDEEKARQLLSELRRLLPGYLVPKLVREQAGENAKTLLL